MIGSCRMKLALICITCFVAVSLTKTDGNDGRKDRFPLFLVTLGSDDFEKDVVDQRAANELDRLRGSNFPSLQQYHHNENVNQFYYPPIAFPEHFYQQGDEAPYSDTSGRQKNRLRRPPVAPRLFFDGLSNFFPSGFYSRLSSLSTSIYSTATTYLIFNSTITTTAVTNCIPALSFSTSNNVAQTQGCRRKRDIQEWNAIKTNNDDITDRHSSDEPVFDDGLISDQFGKRVHYPEILSSKETVSDGHHLPAFARWTRSARYTITSTFTSYSIVTLNTTKTVAGTSWICLPSGWKTC